MIVNTSKGRLGHQVLVAPQWIKHVSRPEATVLIDRTRRVLKDARLATRRRR